LGVGPDTEEPELRCAFKQVSNTWLANDTGNSISGWWVRQTGKLL